MEIDARPQTQASASSRPPQANPDEGADPTVSSDFETFLKLLTTQLKNQDPLNPMDSKDFAVQLATFSGVEQQVRTNDLLEKMSGGGALGGLSEASAIVGREVRAPVPAEYAGHPVRLFADIDPSVDQAALAVRDASGVVVTRVAIDPTLGQYTWDGTDAQGAPVPNGTYSFRIETASEGVPGDVVVPEAYARVVEARLQNGEAMLVFGTGEAIAAADITAIRAPQSE